MVFAPPTCFKDFQISNPTWNVKEVQHKVSKSAWNNFEKQKTWNRCGKSKASNSRHTDHNRQGGTHEKTDEKSQWHTRQVDARARAGRRPRHDAAKHTKQHSARNNFDIQSWLLLEFLVVLRTTLASAQHGTNNNGGNDTYTGRTDEQGSNMRTLCTWKTINIWSRRGHFWWPSIDSYLTLPFETLHGNHFSSTPFETIARKTWR